MANMDTERHRAGDEEQRDRLLRELSDVLQPEPLSESVERRIWDRIDRQFPAAAPPAVRRLRRIGLAVAAAVLALVALSDRDAPPAPADEPAPVVLSAEDAAEIVAAYGVLVWNGPLDYSFQHVSNELDAIEQRIERSPTASADLPWEPEDDWDAPPAEPETTSPRPAATRRCEFARGVPRQGVQA